MLNDACIENLRSLRAVVEPMSDGLYGTPLEVLSDASIGQHVRHVLEFYICLFEQMESGTINYDKRKRNLTLESEVQYALETIEHIRHRIDTSRSDKPLQLTGDYGTDTPGPYLVNTNFQRELAYNLEHSIHHQALIKIGLRQLGLTTQNKDFGVAASTIRNQNNN